MKKLLIIGASGHGKVIADIAVKMNKWNTIKFLDDDENIKKCLDFDVIGKTKDAKNYIEEYDIFVAIGNNFTRKKIQSNLEEIKASIPILIHPNSIISDNVSIENGTVIMPGVVINSSTKIGKGCIINTSSSLDHDNEIGDYVHISPGVHIGGTVRIGESSWLGIGSTVINNINICENCKIGAGAIVVKNIIDPGTYVGIPAKKLN